MMKIVITVVNDEIVIAVVSDENIKCDDKW